MSQAPDQLVRSVSALSDTQHEIMGRVRLELTKLYRDWNQDDLNKALAELEHRVRQATASRPAVLKMIDAKRADTAKWFARPGRPAYCAYIDRFGGTLMGTADQVAYLKHLGVGLFHPLPLLEPRPGDSDGGFAVKNFREVDPRLGNLGDLVVLAETLRSNDISLVLDVVCNHTAQEHEWATKMVAGDPKFRDFYIVLRSNEEVDEWSGPLRDVFPDTAPGNFTYSEAAGGWVWSTFYPFQWDLNYANPWVFVEMVDTFFFLANAGVEGFRLDSTTYLWKEKGTECRNLRGSHTIVSLWKDLLSIVAPSVFLLAEAIENLEAVLPFFGSETSRECDLAYNNTVMTALWGALADQNTHVLAQAITEAGRKPNFGSWLNYVRCHDDIIWIALTDLVPAKTLSRWSAFYNDHNHFADGMGFQAPPGMPVSTCGMAASLAGVGIDDFGLDRLKLIYGVTYAIDGVPMIYMGDEIAMLNDYSFQSEPDRQDEFRWLNRPYMDWSVAGQPDRAPEYAAEMTSWLKTLSQVLLALDIDCEASAEILPHADEALLVVRRVLKAGALVCIANFSDRHVTNIGYQGHVLAGEQNGPGIGPWQTIWLRVEV